MTAGLVGTAARLRLALLRGSLRSGPGSGARRAGLILGVLGGILLASVAFSVLARARGSGRVPEDLSVLLFSALVLGWIVLPVLTFGSDDLLDPNRLALLPLTRRQLLVVLGTGALIGAAPVATLCAALGLLPATGSGPGSYVVGLGAVVLLLALCVAASRACAAALSGLLRSRRGRDLGVLLTALVGVSFQVLNPVLQARARGGGSPREELSDLAAPLRWTPPGLLATAPGRSLPAGLGSLALVAVVVAVVLALWERSVRRALERPDSSASRRRRHRSSLVPRLVPLPADRRGAVAAKDLRYIAREPRRLIALVFGVLVPLVALLAPFAVNGRGLRGGFVFAVVGLGLFGGLSGANRLGLDGSAIWLLLSTRTDPRDAARDLVGGELAAAVVVTPVVLLVGLVLAAVTGGWRYLPPAFGLALGLFAIMLGISSLLCVAAAFPVPESTNAFGGGSAGQGLAAGAASIGGLAGGVGLALPMLGLLLPALLADAGRWWGVALLVAGPAYGLGVGAAVRRRAARRWTARGPEVLELLAAAR